ncbi:hypothetical protein HDU79_004026 [Rhizoclosmatium sp. JEL0117]|nr:hypothetical protein HDU79_004026 [Rhizoclosmatium sp. JEL0117]
MGSSLSMTPSEGKRRKGKAGTGKSHLKTMPDRSHQRALHARAGGDVLRTKICCTIGPASYGYENIGKLVEGGMNVARLNLSHCTRETAETVVNDLRRYLKETNSTAQVAVWLDINGPKIRTGKLAEHEVYLNAGDDFTFVNDQSIIGDKTKVSSTYTKELLKVGDKLFVDDGLLSFTVKERVANGILCSVDNSGYLGEFKGINMPDYVVEELPTVSAKDAADIAFANLRPSDSKTDALTTALSTRCRESQLSVNIP